MTLHNHHHAAIQSARSARRGSILLLVLIVVATLALVTSSQMLMMQNETRATRLAHRQQQARCLAESGVAYLTSLLAMEPLAINQVGGLYENRELLQGVLVDDDLLEEYRGRFTVLSPAMINGQPIGFRYGLEDESAKLNLNGLLQQANKSQPNRSQPNRSTDSGDAGLESGSSNVSSGGSLGASSDDSLGSSSGSSSDSSSMSMENSPRTRLMGLPGMRREIADAILDYLDADDLPRLYGAETETYQGLDPPTLPANGPITHLDQLLAVPGVTPELLYGADTNQNYAIDTHEGWPEEIADEISDLVFANGGLDRGWSAYLTTASAERLANPDGEPRIDINSSDLQALSKELNEVISADETTFIIALRQNGPMSNEPTATGSSQLGTGLTSGGNSGAQSGRNKSGSSGLSGVSSGTPSGASPGASAAQLVEASKVSIDYKKPGKYQLTTLFDLVGVRVQLENANQNGPGQNTPGQNRPGQNAPGQNNQGPAQMLESPWTDSRSTFRSDWLELADYVGVDAIQRLSGRVNINQASRVVLGTLDLLAESEIEQILSRRDQQLDPVTSDQRHTCWLLAEGIVSLDKMKQLDQQVTTQGAIHRGQVIGFFESGKPVARLEVVIDCSDGEPKLIGWDNLSGRGPGFKIDTLGVEE